VVTGHWSGQGDLVSLSLNLGENDREAKNHYIAIPVDIHFAWSVTCPNSVCLFCFHSSKYLRRVTIIRNTLARVDFPSFLCILGIMPQTELDLK